MPSSSGRHSTVFNLFSKNPVARVKNHCPLWGQGLPLVCPCILEHSRYKGASEAPSYKEGSRGAKRWGGLCDLPRVTQLIVGLGQSSLLTPSPGLVPPLMSSPPRQLCSRGGRGKREKPCDRVPRGRSRKPRRGGGAQGYRDFSATLGVVNRNHGHWAVAGGEAWAAAGALPGLRSRRLEQTKLHHANSISSNRWASGQKNSARWQPTVG